MSKEQVYWSCVWCTIQYSCARAHKCVRDQHSCAHVYWFSTSPELSSLAGEGRHRRTGIQGTKPRSALCSLVPVQSRWDGRVRRAAQTRILPAAGLGLMGASLHRIRVCWDLAALLFAEGYQSQRFHSPCTCLHTAPRWSWPAPLRGGRRWARHPHGTRWRTPGAPHSAEQSSRRRQGGR